MLLLSLLFACPAPAPVINNYYIIQDDTGGPADDTAEDSRADDTGDSNDDSDSQVEDSDTGPGDSSPDSDDSTDDTGAEDSDTGSGDSSPDSDDSTNDTGVEDSGADSIDSSTPDSGGDSAGDSGGDSAEDSSSTDSGGDSGDSGTTAPSCDYTTTATITGMNITCANDIWEVEWSLGGMPDHVHMDANTVSGGNVTRWYTYSEQGHFTADCCSGGTADSTFFGLPCTGTSIDITITVYNAFNQVIDCGNVGTGLVSNGCTNWTAAPLACTP